MKILLLIDKPKSAIDRLSQSIKRHNPHHDIRILSLHPKRPTIDEIDNAVKAYEWCDILHVAYWKSGEKLKQSIDISKKPSLLCHYNPYDLTITRKKAGEGLASTMLWSNDSDEAIPLWDKMYSAVVVGNETMEATLAYCHYIPYGIDLDFWKFNKEYTQERIVNMVVGRIESSKGVLEVAEVCKELNYKFILVGRISDQAYFDEIKKINPDMEFREDINDETLRETYYQSAIHVCNSKDNFESGTLPILEAMACGVPVLTRNVGHVPELFDGYCPVVRQGAKEDKEDLRAVLFEMMENELLRIRMRDKQWNTIKNWTDTRMARRFDVLYSKVWRSKKELPFVSIIVPTFDKPEVLEQCLNRIIDQNYEFIEIVVADSGNSSSEDIVNRVRQITSKPIKYIRFENRGDYTLAKARNLAVMHSIGDILVFCDERIGMEQGAVKAFVDRVGMKNWVWGIKDDTEKGFVENFSAVLREDFIRYGMFNERIDGYGGMGQELSERFKSNGFEFEIVHGAKARALAKGKSKSSRKESIVRQKYNIFMLYGRG